MRTKEPTQDMHVLPCHVVHDAWMWCHSVQPPQLQPGLGVRLPVLFSFTLNAWGSTYVSLVVLRDRQMLTYLILRTSA